MTTYNICFIRLRSWQPPDDGHVLWSKNVGTVNNKFLQRIESESLCAPSLFLVPPLLTEIFTNITFGYKPETILIMLFHIIGYINTHTHTHTHTHPARDCTGNFRSAL